MMSPQSSPKTASKEEMQLLWKMTGLAFQFGSEIIAGVLLGWGVDAFFGTAPWGVVIGAIAGIAVGTLDLLRRAIQINRQMDRAQQTMSRITGGSPMIRHERGEQEAEKDLLDSEFEQAMDHSQWKKLQDRRLQGDDDQTDEHDQHDGPGKPHQKG